MFILRQQFQPSPTALSTYAALGLFFPLLQFLPALLLRIHFNHLFSLALLQPLLELPLHNHELLQNQVVASCQKLTGQPSPITLQDQRL